MITNTNNIHIIDIENRVLFIHELNNDRMMSQYELRKVTTQGNHGLSYSVVIPPKIIDELKIAKGTYMRVSIWENKVLMEKIDG